MLYFTLSVGPGLPSLREGGGGGGRVLTAGALMVVSELCCTLPCRSDQDYLLFGKVGEGGGGGF